MEMNIKITDTAAAHIQKLMDDAPDNTAGIRLTVKATGCSGNSYKMEYADSQSDADDVIEDNGATVYVPKMYSWMLIGTTIDYITDDLGNSRFDFINPNEVGRCGCGESFQVQPLKEPVE